MASTHKIEYEYISYTDLSLNPTRDVQSSCITIMYDLVIRRRPMESAQYVFLDNSHPVGKDQPFLDHMQDSARTANRARLAASHGQGCKRGLASYIALQSASSCTVQERYELLQICAVVYEANNGVANASLCLSSCALIYSSPFLTLPSYNTQPTNRRYSIRAKHHLDSYSARIAFPLQHTQDALHNIGTRGHRHHPVTRPRNPRLSRQTRRAVVSTLVSISFPPAPRRQHHDAFHLPSLCFAERHTAAHKLHWDSERQQHQAGQVQCTAATERTRLDEPK
jgi:hypothetical protein